MIVGILRAAAACRPRDHLRRRWPALGAAAGIGRGRSSAARRVAAGPEEQRYASAPAASKAASDEGDRGRRRPAVRWVRVLPSPRIIYGKKANVKSGVSARLC